MNTQNHTRRSGFTLIEMTVAVAIFLVILTIVLVPLRFGLNSFALGRARAETQGAIGASISDIERDLRRAVVVFPNSELAGVINDGPYYLSGISDTGTQVEKNRWDDVVCSGARWSNTSRIDMILARKDDSTGTLISPVQASETLVSYYPRRLNANQPYDPIDNPVVLFRAEIPFRAFNPSGTSTPIVVGTPLPTPTPSPVNAEISLTRFPALPCGGQASRINRSSLWLAHNYYGEANLEPLTQDFPSTPAVANRARSHVLAMPRGLGLLVNNADCTADPCNPLKTGLLPESTFSTFDTDNDGKIDRVNISLTFTSFDAVESNRLRDNQPVGQQLRASRVVDLPNVR